MKTIIFVSSAWLIILPYICLKSYIKNKVILYIVQYYFALVGGIGLVISLDSFFSIHLPEFTQIVFFSLLMVGIIVLILLKILYDKGVVSFIMLSIGAITTASAFLTAIIDYEYQSFLTSIALLIGSFMMLIIPYSGFKKIDKNKDEKDITHI